MAVVNSFNQIFIPGIDELVSNNLDTVLSTNDTIDAINTNLAVGGTLESVYEAVDSANIAIDALPSKNPYPTFATWSNYNDNPYYNIYDSNMSPIGSGKAYTDGEMWNNWRDYFRTNSTIGSSSWTTTRFTQSTCFNQADGHWMLNLRPGHDVAVAKQPDAQDSYMPFFGVVIGKEGVRQNFSLFLSGTTMRIMPRGGMEGFFDSLNINNTTYMDTNGTTSYGMVGYNDRTRTLVAIFSKDNSNNYRMHIWKNEGPSNSLNSDNYQSGTLRRFLSEAKLGLSEGGEAASYEFFDFQWQANSSQNYNESRHRMRVIPGDNGLIGMTRFVPSNRTHYATYDPATSTLNTSFNSLAATTSYGIDNGGKYGMRHQITWDNNWVVGFSQYYYYGAGINAIFVDVRDPRNYYIGQWSSTSVGAQILPIQASKFVMGRSDNFDSSVGIRLSMVDPEGALKYGRTESGTISNGGNISLTRNTPEGLFDTYYTSTNYGALVAMPHWKVSI